MKVATIAYAPPRRIPGAKAFVDNVGKYATENPVYIFSDDRTWPNVVGIENPEVVKHPRITWAVSNCVFLFGLRLALQLDLDYFLYLEADCRVKGDLWDKALFDEIMPFVYSAGASDDWPVVAGTPVCYNPSGSGHEALKRVTQMAWEHLQRTGRAMAIYGFQPGLSLFPNGALAIYHTQTIAKMYPGFAGNIGRTALATHAFDMHIGKQLWGMFGMSLFERFVCSVKGYSGCTDDLVTFAERKAWLESGAVVGIHQVKNDYCP